MEQKRRVRRRQRDPDAAPSERRSNRVNLAYNDAELTVLTAAAARAGMAPAAWAADAALSVAKEVFVPVATGTKEVLAEFIQARNQVARIGNNVNQIAKALNADDDATTSEQIAAALRVVETAVRRMDEATQMVMRERRPRP
ncbi:plasmid mobilization relaxosome protein MobC [Streptomyces lavendulocolor]|uniref:plasmid mobilization relaxosome protein MobC n=1 Tax=Streptomyces lavendulocolor TaxID=67316 RepID=UPI0031DC5F69